MKSLAFIDSGIGGLPYLVQVRNTVPHLPMTYVADTLRFPYGPKSESEVIDAVTDMTRRLFERCAPSAVVVACNTASVLALDHLRKTFPVPFIGVVPAVKPAAAVSRSGVIAVMATQRTVSGTYLDELIADFARGKTVIKYAATELIKKIEEDPFMEDTQGFIGILDRIKAEFLEQGVDTVVLGCTHFLHLDHVFEERFGSSFAILDSRNGVCKRTMEVLDQVGPVGAPLTASEHDCPSRCGGAFYITGATDPAGLYGRVARRFGLEFGGEL